MQIISDFQLHSPYSMATSKNTTIKNLAAAAKVKGLQMMGTGDFTHPKWLKEIRKDLTDVSGANLFKHDETFFMLTGEVSTIYYDEGICKRIHHMLHAPNFEVVEQINEKLSKYGRLASDGRPIVKVSSPQLVEELMSIDKRIFIYPAHVWTPWFGALGSKSGYDTIEDCYKDQTKHIHAIETGLSSDPTMNRMVSSLDKFALLSSSDSHSPNIWRIGREANVFDLKKITYENITNAIKKNDGKNFKFTIEVDPNYGKYHYDGCSKCGVSMKPSESKKHEGKCPKCKKGMTIGVLFRAEELADREESSAAKKSPDFKSLLPLYEIIAYSLGMKQITSKKVFNEHSKLMEKFGNEMNVLLDVPKEELQKFTNEKVVNAVMKLREGRVRFHPGYDGEYGVPIFDDSMKIKRSY